MRLIDADAFDRDLANTEFTAALNDAADQGKSFENKPMYYSTQSIRDVLKCRPTIDAVPIKPLCAWLAANALQRNCLAQYAKDWENDLRKWMREHEERN